MLHTANPVIKHKAGLLNLAEELSNVSKACKIMGVSRDTFYRYRELVAEGGVDAQINRSRRAPNLKNRTDEATEQAVVDYAVAFPTHGQHRASNELRKQGVFISDSGVRSVWLLHNLENLKLNNFYQVTFRKKLYGVLDAVGATISTPAEPWTIGPPYWGMSPWRAAGFPLMVYFLFLSRQEFILIRKDYLFSDRDSH